MPWEVELQDFTQRRSDADFFFELDGHRAAAMQSFEIGDFDSNLPSHWHGRGDETHPRHSTQPTWPTLLRRLRSQKLLIIGAFVLVLLVAIFSIVLTNFGGKGSSGEPEPTAPAEPVEPFQPVHVAAAQAMTGWRPCEVASKARLPFETAHPRDGSHGESVELSPSCRQFRVPLDYQNPQGEGIIVTVMRNRQAVDPEEGQLWLLQGGPGVPSHVLLDPIPFLRVSNRVIYALDHRGTGWSTLLDCPKARAGKEWGKMWMKWVGLGNASVEFLTECLAEVSRDIGEPGMFSTTNAARDLAAVILAITKEQSNDQVKKSLTNQDDHQNARDGNLRRTSTKSAIDVGIHGLSYGTLWAHHFLQLQGKEFQHLARHVVLDGVFSKEFHLGQYSLAANSAGKRLLTEYCDDDCRFILEVPEDILPWDWWTSAVHNIEETASDSQDLCTQQFRKFLVVGEFGWMAGSSVQEALSIIGYLSVTMGYPMMQEFIQLVMTFQRCQEKSESNDNNDTYASALPDEWWLLARKLEFFSKIAESYWEIAPLDFSAILHHVVAFGEMWDEPPNFGGKVWKDFYAKNIFFAPDFASLMSRYTEVFRQYKYQAPPSRNLVAGSDISTAVLITYGDLDGHTPPASAQHEFQQLQFCKVKAELKPGKHCVSNMRCMREVVDAFYRNDIRCSSDLKLEPSADLTFALDNLQACSSTPRWQPLGQDRCAGRLRNLTQRKMCFQECIHFLEDVLVGENARCRCREVMQCGPEDDNSECVFVGCPGVTDAAIASLPLSEESGTE